jgi:hypothetical protein
MPRGRFPGVGPPEASRARAQTRPSAPTRLPFALEVDDDIHQLGDLPAQRRVLDLAGFAAGRLRRCVLGCTLVGTRCTRPGAGTAATGAIIG